MPNQYVRFGTVAVEEGLLFLQGAIEKNWARGMILGQSVKTRSLRLSTFALKGTTCPHCGLAATFFALERPISSPATDRYHLNLWGVNQEGEEVLFTHDHIVPKARGGVDALENCQTMCGPCNWKKKDSLENEVFA